jgi:hypothetical protein
MKPRTQSFDPGGSFGTSRRRDRASAGPIGTATGRFPGEATQSQPTWPRSGPDPPWASGRATLRRSPGRTTPGRGSGPSDSTSTTSSGPLTARHIPWQGDDGVAGAPFAAPAGTPAPTTPTATERTTGRSQAARTSHAAVPRPTRPPIFLRPRIDHPLPLPGGTARATAPPRWRLLQTQPPATLPTTSGAPVSWAPCVSTVFSTLVYHKKRKKDSKKTKFLISAVTRGPFDPGSPGLP